MIMDTFFYLQSHPFFFWILFILVSLSLGSFLGLLTYRLPLMLYQHWKEQCETIPHEISSTNLSTPFNLCFPRSQCPQCHVTLTGWQLIPLLGFFLQKGKCSACHHKISPRYPLIESITVILSIVVFLKYGFSLPSFMYLLFTWILLSITVIDIEHQIIPDELNYILMWLGLLWSLSSFHVSPRDSIIGAITGYLFLWLIGSLYTRCRKKEGLGHGDYKLFAALGAWLGWQPLPFLLLLSALVGLLAGGTVLLLKKQSLKTPLAFGPYLALGGWIMMMFPGILS